VVLLQTLADVQSEPLYSASVMSVGVMGTATARPAKVAKRTEQIEKKNAGSLAYFIEISAGN